MAEGNVLVINEIRMQFTYLSKYLQVWINYKAKTKKKIIEEYSLSPLEQTVADLLHTELDVNPPGDSFDDPSSSEPSCSLQSSSFSSIKETTTDQFALLLREVEKTPELAKHTPAFGPYRNHEDWEKIAKKLNAIGPPERSMREWTKVSTSSVVSCASKFTRFYIRCFVI